MDLNDKKCLMCNENDVEYQLSLFCTKCINPFDKVETTFEMNENGSKQITTHQMETSGSKQISTYKLENTDALLFHLGKPYNCTTCNKVIRKLYYVQQSDPKIVLHATK